MSTLATAITQSPNSAAPRADGLRADRALLKKPRQQADGSWVYDGILVTADVPLEYPWGTEIPTVACISDPVYLAQLVGLSVISEQSGAHRMGHVPDVSVDPIAGGVITKSWFDAENACTCIQVVANRPELLKDIQVGGLTDLSETYQADTIPHESRPRTFYQVARRTKHVAVCLDGRSEGASLRADSLAETPSDPSGSKEARMTEEEARKLREERDSAIAERDDMVAKIEAERAEYDRRVMADACEVADLKMQADSEGIELPEDGTLEDWRKALAVALGAEAERADSKTYYPAWLDAHKTLKAKGLDSVSRNAQRVKSEGKVNADSTSAYKY